MSSVETVVRAKLEEWAEAVFLPILPTLTVNAEPPDPGAPEPLPTLALWAPSSSSEIRSPIQLAVSTVADTYAGWIVGDKDASLEVLWRLGSRAEAYTIREAWANMLALTALAYDGIAGGGIPQNLASGQALTHKWALDWADILDPEVVDEVETAITLSVYWSGDDELAGPEQTGVQDLWELRYNARIAYPWAVSAPIRRWDVILANEDGDSPTVPFNLNSLPT